MFIAMTILGATSPPRFPIGHSDYAQLRRQGLTYVDKTMWVADVLDSPANALLIPRPRRFGKTLNMTTMSYFVERSPDDRTDLFEDTALWRADDGRYQQHFQRYPVIYLTFKDIKATSWEVCWYHMRELLQRTISELERLGHVTAENSGDLRKLLKMSAEDAPPHTFHTALADMAGWCHSSTGEPAIILIDEYDSPLHSAWQHGYWGEAVTFFRHFLSAGLKNNPHVFKGVMTGILKVAKEGIFSGLNHLRTATILGDIMADRFGFTESDVAALTACEGREHDEEALRRWYNGYRFGGHHPHIIYNPWSVLSYLDEPGVGPRSFWKNTSDNALVRSLLMRHAAEAGPVLETLLTGGTIRRVVDEDVALQDLNDNPDAFIGLLLFSGYLTAASVNATQDGLVAELRIPNLEVRGVFADTFGHQVQRAAQPGGSTTLNLLVRALLEADALIVEDALGTLLRNLLSHHDVAGERVEAVYQAFMVGLLVHLQPTHRVYSNREAGYGRADILIVPRDTGPGAVLELKRVLSRETPEQALSRAVAQLVDRDYASEIRAAGATDVHQYAVVFDGKRCWVQVVDSPA